ncbi:hypothetical protein [Helicovermis profundi]|uniref:SAP domain-containing protein n=1 Tax=Helicovermis profundi TaxID=3065157 RepID=A0AAU9EN50_9FIRM|nr:hypothetical protein HLPR_18800 [Clostridia bacterium S502]
MKFKSVIESLATITDLKRVSSAYVIDYRNLQNEEVKNALLKTAPQYYYNENVEKALNSLLLSSNRDERILAPIIIKNLLLHTDDFKSTQKELSDSVIEYEQNTINKSNDFFDNHKAGKQSSFEFFKFVLEAAWEKDGSISVDEKNLLNKIRIKLNITDDERNVLEASIGKFPSLGNNLHTRETIDIVKRKLQSSGLLFCIRDENKINYDVIPEEIASTLKSYFNIEMKHHGFMELLDSKHFRNKAYLKNILDKSGLNINNNLRLDDLKELCLTHINPSILLGGYSSRDGFDTATLSKWCSELHLQTSGQKSELIARVIDFYDNLRKDINLLEDNRIIYFEYFEDLASRNLDQLRSQNIIVKDLECEKYFERATDYIFEELLVQKPLALKGTEHPDGMLSYQEKIIMWDNKSKETEVNLADHIKQFDRYIKNSEKKVPIFLVIGPSFTENSINVAMQYMLENDTIISLVSANELKELAINWNKKYTKGADPFPLGYFKQPGRFNKNLVNI